MLFITHALPKNLQVDEVVRIGQGSLSAVAPNETTQRDSPKSGQPHGAATPPQHQPLRPLQVTQVPTKG
jgi:hypothetical protein